MLGRDQGRSTSRDNKEEEETGLSMHRQVIWKQPWSKQRHWKHKVSNFKIKQEATTMRAKQR